MKFQQIPNEYIVGVFNYIEMDRKNFAYKASLLKANGAYMYRVTQDDIDYVAVCAISDWDKDEKNVYIVNERDFNESSNVYSWIKTWLRNLFKKL